MKNISLIFVLMTFLSACTQMTTVNSSVISPIKAIELSAESAPVNLKGIFEFKVKSTDSEQRLEFLNSEIDDLDQRNLSIALRPNAVKELKQRFGDNPKVFMLDKNIRVKGEAKRVKTWVLYNNKNTKRYYYQTKIFVKSADQLTIL